MTPRNEDEKAFMKTFDALCYAQSRYKVWADFVCMTAISLVNTVDKTHFEKREEQYKRIVKGYKPEQMRGFVDLLAITVGALERNPFQDFLGDLYMRCDLGNEHAGQFFTPYHVSEFMAKISVDSDSDVRREIEKKGYASVCDPCVGGGGMLIAAAQAFHAAGVNYQRDVLFVGQDIDQTVAMMAYIQLTLLGCAGYIKVGNSLTDPLVGHPLFGENSENIYYTPFFFTEIWHMRRVCEQMKSLFRGIGQNPNESQDIKKPEKFFFFFDQEAKQWTKKPSGTLTPSC